MKSLVNIQSEQILAWIAEIKEKATKGKMIQYIPLLESVDPEYFAFCIFRENKTICSFGDQQATFPLMSVIKPFLLLYILFYRGADQVFKTVGHKPSSYPFNSLDQLIIDGGFPRNPMLNSGAMTLACLLPGKDGYSRCENLRLWLNSQCGSQLFLSESILSSVNSQPNAKNQSLIRELFDNGYINDPEVALDTYNRICCLGGNIEDLAKLGSLLVSAEGDSKIVLDLMLNCGLYEASEKFSQRVGLPTKSGVSGAIVSIVPKQGAIACYSPPLDQQGNSVVGLWLIEKIAHTLKS